MAIDTRNNRCQLLVAEYVSGFSIQVGLSYHCGI
jgi:hypothetical protein